MSDGAVNWQWAIPVAITLGMGLIGGIWALVHLVAKLVSEATAMKVRLDLVVPVAQKVPTIEQNLGIVTSRVDEHEDEINGLRDKMHDASNELARVSAVVPRRH